MAITNSTEFLEYLKAGRRARGLDDSTITAETETTDSSGTRRYDVVMIPRKPQNARPQGSSTTPEQQGYHR
jgi:hypothetical protein